MCLVYVCGGGVCVYTHGTLVCIGLHLNPFLPPVCLSSLPQCLHDVPAVREAAAETLGTALKVVGERGMAAYLDGLESLKMSKVRSCDIHVTDSDFIQYCTFLYMSLVISCSVYTYSYQGVFVHSNSQE